MVLIYLSVPAGHDSVTLSQRVQYQDPETEAPKWNLATSYFISQTFAFSTVTCQNIFRKKGLSLQI